MSRLGRGDKRYVTTSINQPTNQSINQSKPNPLVFPPHSQKIPAFMQKTESSPTVHKDDVVLSFAAQKNTQIMQTNSNSGQNRMLGQGQGTNQPQS